MASSDTFREGPKRIKGGPKQSPESHKLDDWRRSCDGSSCKGCFLTVLGFVLCQIHVSHFTAFDVASMFLEASFGHVCVRLREIQVEISAAKT